MRKIRAVGGRTALLFIALIAPSSGNGQVASEYQLKAAFLYNFTKFVEWPAQSLLPSSPLRLCLLGENSFGSDLTHITDGKAVAGHPVQVSTIDSWQLARECQVLFIDSSERLELREILSGLRGRSILTVGDSKNFAAQGGMIGLLVENERVRFEVNLGAANEAHLKISSKLLSLAKVVLT